MLRISRKLNDPSTTPKSYWAILNWVLKNKKIPRILPIFHNDKVISDFNEKTNLFNSFFASYCTLVSNSSVLPNISFHKNTRLNSFSITKKDILAIIKSLDLNKFYEWDNISIKMKKICGKSLSLHLKLVCEAALSDGVFPDD